MNSIDASRPENKALVYRNLYGNRLSGKPNKPKFQVGDKVRVSKKSTLKKDTHRDGLKRYLLFPVNNILIKLHTKYLI